MGIESQRFVQVRAIVHDGDRALEHDVIPRSQSSECANQVHRADVVAVMVPLPRMGIARQMKKQIGLGQSFQPLSVHQFSRHRFDLARPQKVRSALTKGVVVCFDQFEDLRVYLGFVIDKGARE